MISEPCPRVLVGSVRSIATRDVADQVHTHVELRNVLQIAHAVDQHLVVFRRPIVEACRLHRARVAQISPAPLRGVPDNSDEMHRDVGQPPRLRAVVLLDRLAASCRFASSSFSWYQDRVLETADAFLDDKADRLWRTRSAALRELAQKVRDGTDLVLLCAGRIESCHGDLLRKGILADAAQLEATSKKKPRSDKGKPRGPRGPRADSVETAARMGVLSTFYLRHAYGRDSPGLHEEDGVLSANGGVLCAGCGEEAPGLGARDGKGGDGGGAATPISKRAPSRARAR